MRRTIILLLSLLFALPLPALPQERSGPSKAQKQPTPALKRAPPDLRVQATQVAEQLKLLTRFLYLYGRISAGLEAADEQARRGETSEALLAKHRQNKASVAANINDLRAGLEKLEQGFHANPRLHRQYLKLLRASEVAVSAEQLAAANRFDEAGRALVGVAERLADLAVDVR